MTTPVNIQDPTYTFSNAYVDPQGRLKTLTTGNWSRVGARQVLFHHDFSRLNPSMYNDAAGGAWRDNDVTFMGRPTARLDPMGINDSATQSGAPLDTSGVIYKIRLASPQTGAGAGVYGFEGWMRFTSNGCDTDIYPSVALYYRDGTNAYHSKVWIDTVTDSASKLVDLKYFNSAGTFTQFGQYLYQVSGHAYNPFAKLYDKAGGWHYFRLVTDMGTLKYTSFQFNEVTYDLSANSIRTSASTSQTMLHFSVEMNQHTSSRRWINIADLVGTRES